MTATDAAPDPAAATERRWQDLLDRIHDLEAQVAATTSTVHAALDTHLARLDALRHHLDQPTWPLPAPDPGSPQTTAATSTHHRVDAFADVPSADGGGPGINAGPPRRARTAAASGARRWLPLQTVNIRR
ncbi:MULTISPECIES: hypothetical protein [Kitasatospora]|uniref:hypothetical protein n=1 Tax=Kitasatospora TaxID=2063 RepID=UPI0031DFA1FE